MFLVQVFANCIYDIVYDIEKKFRHRIRYAKFTSPLYDIACLYRMHRHYYKISYAKIYKNLRQYSTISHTIFLSCTWAGVCGGSHWPCPWSAHRSCLMILGPTLCSVLNHHSPDALSLSLAWATANVSGVSLVRAKMVISS